MKLTRNYKSMTHAIVRIVLILPLFILPVQLSAQVDIVEFEDPAKEQLYRDLVDELRCLVCANQNLSGSNSALAVDLRRKVHEMLTAGDSRDDVIAYMVERYGDYVLYKPPFNKSTFVLWCAPVIILLITLWLAIRSRNRDKDAANVISDTDRIRARELLAGAGASPDKSSGQPDPDQ